MKLPDTNVWLALALSKHSHHAAAKAWWNAQDVVDDIAFCRSTQLSSLRLLTTAALMAAYGIQPLSNRDAWSVYEAFAADDRVRFEPEPSDVAEIWPRLATRRTSSPKLWMDAYLAAFALATGAQLVTTDTAFTQFKGLSVRVLGTKAES